MILAIFGGTFLDNSSGHFDPINYFFGAGIATNIGASLICQHIGEPTPHPYFELHAAASKSTPLKGDTTHD